MAPPQGRPRGEAAAMNRRPKRSFAAPLAITALVALVAAAVLPALAQQAKLTVDDDCTVFAFSPSGNRIVYAARRISEQRVARDKKMLVEQDDLWQVTIDGHKKRLVDGKKLVKSPVPVSFQIQAIRIAPDDRHMTIQMITRTLVPNREGESSGKVQSGELTDLMDGEGKEIDIAGTNPRNSAIFGATNAAWLADGQTVVYLTQPKNSLLYQIAYVRPEGGTGGAILPDHYYAAVAWSPAHNAGAAIQRDKDLGGPIRLVWIDLVHKTERTLATLKGYSGHLTVSPSGKQIAYFRDGDTMEIRSVADPDKVTSFKLPFGRYEWSADDSHLLLKRGPNDQTDQLLWISLPSGNFEYAFHGLIYHNFHVSPDGRWVAVTEPGKQILKLFPVP
jgi:dipeptidyl aminopeptidase/acylaminoacyl peptidase